MIPPMAKEISRTKLRVLCDAVRMDEIRRTAGNSVRIAEYAAAFATANWSCSSVLTVAILTCFRNRSIKGAVPGFSWPKVAMVIVIERLRLRYGEAGISRDIFSAMRAAFPF
jgi:hypothetical protein